MNTYGIGCERLGDGHKLPVRYYIVEQGIRLPMRFETAEAASVQIRFLKAFSLTRDEILGVVADQGGRS